ncbi:MAG: hypothetical protein IJF08_07640 [Clostridia bacterium]|nr:hypothetical protein [Clostridia bacterium]
MKKEILTDEVILQDILKNEEKKAQNNDNKTLIWVMPIAALAILAGYAVSWVLAIPIGLLAIVPIVLYFKQNKKDREIVESVEYDGEFVISTDKLSHIDKEQVYEPHTHYRPGMSTHTHYTKCITVFYFDNAKWRVPETEKLYAWSKEMYISPEGLDNTSLRGDEFYLVSRKGEAEVAYAYNRKFFEYKGNHTVS